MKFELAPMEGLTTYIYRNAYARYFGGIDKYYTPFLSLHKEKEFNHKERQEILPESNTGLHVIPQVLTNSPEDFLRAAGKLKALGYEEININLGCPSGTVTTKTKGAGMLAEPERLEHFLEEIFEKTPVKISVKTRLGMEQAQEWDRLLEIYNKYPISELIVHARVREDFYKNKPNWEAFGRAVAESKNPVCYNGDVFAPEDYRRLVTAFPKLESVMLGRGILANPGLIEEIGQSSGDDFNARLQAFHNEIFEGYKRIMSGDRDVLFKMKELWTYMVHSFPDADKHTKKLRKTKTCAEYADYVKLMFREKCER